MPIIGGVCVWGFAGGDAWISPGGARDGDVILLTKGPAVEAAALLAVLYREWLADRLDAEIIGRACARTNQITVVRDALAAFETGGVHAMHDATEGGVLGGLWEMAAASALRVQADLDAVPVPGDIAAVARALEFDPWAAISEGTLLAAVAPSSVDEVMAAWQAEGIEAWAVGQFSSSAPPSTVRREGRTSELGEPGRDPFWDIFFAGLK
jgi:hydrogenase maturation factor